MVLRCTITISPVPRSRCLDRMANTAVPRPMSTRAGAARARRRLTAASTSASGVRHAALLRRRKSSSHRHALSRRRTDATLRDIDCAIVPHGIDRTAAALARPCAVTLLPVPRDGKDVIGVVGAMSALKGARRLERLVLRTRKHNLPLRWVLVGYFTDRSNWNAAWQDTDKVLTIHGPYEPGQLGALLDGYGIGTGRLPRGWRRNRFPTRSRNAGAAG